ncbi:uncharacterized protein BDFB_009840, partial [Asbolus verrucosus]
MTLKGVVLCIVTLIPVIASFYTYPPCPQVTILDLSHNEFQIFPEDLNIYTNLIYLNLSHNKIQSLGVGAFRKLRNLQRLDLTYNKFSDWMDIRSNAFAFAKSLIVLDFSHNPLRSLPGEKNPLQINSLEILRLNNCSIDNLNNKFFEKLPRLKELHLSENPIKSIRSNFASHSLKFLDLSRCNLQHIIPTAFTNLTALQTIFMYQNINLKKFTCDSLSLLYLDLADCNLEMVPHGYLPNVYAANFRGNHFRIIPKFSFVNFTSLKLLDLSYNAISVVEENAFSGLVSIERIDLSLNTLSRLSREMFYSNEELRVLNLSRNYFSKVQNFDSPSLEVLDLSSCEIHSVDKDSLVDMSSLKILNLSKNVISLLPDNWQAINLITLDVSLCRIKNINNKTFARMPSLRQVNLAGNRLTTASPECFLQVVSLDISDNPWRCDCPNLKELYFWLSKTGKRIDSLYCQSPEMYEGYSWLSACQKEWHPELNRGDSVWWYTTGLIITVFVILFVILAMRRMYLLKEKRIREANEARRAEEREALRRMHRMQAEALEEASRNAPDPRELQTPPSYNEALLLPRLDSSHPSLSGSLHSIVSKHSINGSLPDVAKRSRPRRKRRRRKSDSSEGQRASRVVVDSDTSEHERPELRATLESDF